jgi:hypothetical protein
VCAGCLNNVTDSPHIGTADKWNYSDCTQIEPTDAYGKLSFPGSTRKNANVSNPGNIDILNLTSFIFKYIRVEIETRQSDLVEFLYNQNGWNLNMPHLILSVLGGVYFKFSHTIVFYREQIFFLKS